MDLWHLVAEKTLVRKLYSIYIYIYVCVCACTNIRNMHVYIYIYTIYSINMQGARIKKVYEELMGILLTPLCAKSAGNLRHVAQ